MFSGLMGLLILLLLSLIFCWVLRLFWFVLFMMLMVCVMMRC